MRLLSCLEVEKKSCAIWSILFRQSPNTERSIPSHILLYGLLACAANTNAGPFNLTEVAQGLYVHQGVTVNLEHPRHDDIANIGFIVGTRCVAVIDTGGSVRVGRQLRQAIRQNTRLPICYVINTHVHYDHVLGNFAFKQDQPQFIGHWKLADAIQPNRGYFLEAFADDLGPDASKDRIIGPDKLVKSNLIMDLGDRKLVLTAHPGAHTNQDLTVFDQKTNSLWLADLLFIERVPALDGSGSLKGWKKLITKLQTRNIARVIPGHGPVTVPWPSSAQPELHYFETLLNESRALIAKGSFLEEAVETVGTSEKGNWLLFDDYHKRNITRAFAELEWE